ncbi:MAG: hypothetical protein HQM12_02145 [SAR324 cluster bacterium]|nr:hypothetical protein [SAR324 cluster bacterium]
MKSWHFLLFSLGINLLTGGCYSLSFYHDVAQLRAMPDGELEQINTVFASRELTPPPSLRRICPSGVSKVEILQSFDNGMLHYLTLGFYSPMSIKVWCNTPPMDIP